MTNTATSYFVPTYARGGSPMISGKGAYLFNADGKKFVDFGSGIAVNALGHAHPAILETINEQASKLIHASNLYLTEPQISLAKSLHGKTFGGKVFLCNSGTEANEAAIKFARKWAHQSDSQKHHILSFRDGFHGRTYGALSATAQEKFHAGFEPLPQGFHYCAFNDIDAAREMLSHHKFCAVFVEPIQGEGGVNLVHEKFLRFLRDYCTEHKIALVFDEIQCGMGRTGYLWAYNYYNIEPDIMTLAKPLGGGLPLGAVVCKEEISSAIKPGDHGTTFGGNPVACAVGAKVLEIVSDPSFLAEVRKKGEHIRKRLLDMSKEFPVIDEVRGLGLLIGLRFREDPAKIIETCFQNGLLVIKAGHNTIRFIPSLTISTSEIDEGLDIFNETMKFLYKKD